jgi:hypothetical protein
MSALTSTRSTSQISAGAANSIAGALTHHIREIERFRSWSSNRELRHWHRQFSEARTLLTTQPPKRLPLQATSTAAMDDDSAAWLEILGRQ